MLRLDPPLRSRHTSESRVARRSSRFALGLSAALLLTGGLRAFDPNAANQQDHESHASSAVTGEVAAAADRVPIGAEFVPRRTDLPNKLIVPAGKTAELPEDSTYDYVEVGGTLKTSRTHDTTLRFTHMVVLPGGTLDVGTQADPIPCDRKVEFVVRNVPIDTAKDPFQWGNGFVNFGRQTRVGCAKTSFVEAAGGLVSGAKSITLASAPSGWQIGDELLIPDTAAPSISSLPRRESNVTIAAINGTELELSKPLDFAHANINDPNGVVVLRPRVANLTRNILLRSEKPDGTPGHTADVGHSASWDIRYNRLAGLGRTRRAPLDDTVADKHIGTNQRGKYAEHHHHVQSAAGSADVGNVYIGHPNGNWGLVIHVTSDALIERNIAVDFPGAAFITEDGYEARNTFRYNLAAYVLGIDRSPYGFFDAAGDVTRNCPGCEGTGFWLRGVMNTFEGNEAWNNFSSGLNFFNQAQPPGQYPSSRGGKPDSTLKHFEDRPVLVTGNVVAANVLFGLEVWGLRSFPYQDLIAAYNGSRQVFAVSSDGVHVYLQSPKLICAVGTGALGVHSSQGYVGSLIIERGEIAGCATGITGGGGNGGMQLTGTVLQNEVNIDELPRNTFFDDVMHQPLGNYPHRYILFNGKVWDGKGPTPNVGISHWSVQRGSRFVVKNWQGTGKDYRLFYKHSLGSNPAWPSSPWPHNFNTPVEGLTMQESWDKFGLAYGGDVLKESEAVQLDGLVNGLAREGLTVHFPPPRAIVTFPTMRENAILEDNIVRVYAILTGNPEAASSVMMVSVDGDKPQALDNKDTDDRSFPTTHISPGVHEIKVWRTQRSNPTVAIPGSEYTSQYCIGPCPTIPHGRIKLSTDNLTFTAAAGAAPAPETVTLTNTGVTVMNWIARGSQPSCDVNQYAGRLEVGASTTFKVFVRPSAGTATIECTVRVADGNSDNSPQMIAVKYSATR